jgi:anaerobic magnesium-protoporphyrin IX monomethyl ester cyclase
MKIMFVSINKLKSYRPALPIGMVMVATQAARHGHAVRCVDLMFEEEDEEVVRREIEDFRPDLLGIAIRNVDSLNILEPAIYTPLALEVASWARSVHPGVRIVLGGAGFTTIPEDLMDFVGADYGIVGFAEESFPLFLRCLEDGGDPRRIDGIILPQGDGSYYKREPDRHINYDRIRDLDRSFYDPRYFSYTFETHNGREVVADTIQTKKGCVLECIFCSNFLIDGTGVHLRDPRSVADEVERLIAQGSTNLEIVDGVFNLPLHHAIAILEEFERRGIHHPWSAMINPGAVDERLVDLMVKTGCKEVQFGTDSGDDRVLTILKKNFRKRHLRDVHRLFETAGITVMHCCFIGSPGDDRRSVFETFDVMDELVPDGHPVSHVYWTFGLRICRGTELFNIAVREGVIDGSERFIIPKYYVSPDVLHDVALLDDIEERVLRNRNWYLWWGLPNISLRDRIAMALEENRRIEELFHQRLSRGVRGPRLPVLAGGGEP